MYVLYDIVTNIFLILELLINAWLCRTRRWLNWSEKQRLMR